MRRFFPWNPTQGLFFTVVQEVNSANIIIMLCEKITKKEENIKIDFTNIIFLQIRDINQIFLEKKWRWPYYVTWQINLDPN